MNQVIQITPLKATCSTSRCGYLQQQQQQQQDF